MPPLPPKQHMTRKRTQASMLRWHTQADASTYVNKNLQSCSFYIHTGWTGIWSSLKRHTLTRSEPYNRMKFLQMFPSDSLVNKWRVSVSERFYSRAPRGDVNLDFSIISLTGKTQQIKKRILHHLFTDEGPQHYSSTLCKTLNSTWKLDSITLTYLVIPGLLITSCRLPALSSVT